MGCFVPGIQQKADRNDAIVRHQDGQMKSLLGYKPSTNTPSSSTGKK